MVKIQATDGEFTVDGYHWTGTNAAVVEFLNAMLSPFGPSGADPDPDHTAALDAMRLIGGEIVHHDELPYEPGRVY